MFNIYNIIRLISISADISNKNYIVTNLLYLEFNFCSFFCCSHVKDARGRVDP